MVASSLVNVENPFPSTSALGQTNAQSVWRALSVKARVQGSNDKTEVMITTEASILRGFEVKELVKRRTTGFHWRGGEGGGQSTLGF